MKKILCLILALVLCFTVFVACDNTEKPEEPAADNSLENATAYLKNMYKGYLTNPETPADYELITSVLIGDDTYTVEWTVNKEAVKVVAVEGSDAVKIDVDEKSSAVLEYELTAVVVAPDGTKGNPLVFKLKVPSANFMSIADALAAEDGTFITVSGTVVLINTPWDDGYKNISVTIEDENGDQLYLYRLGTKVEVGDVIMVKGEMATYNNARQVAQGATAEITGKEEVVLEYVEMTIPEALAASDNALVIVKGTVKSVDTAWSDDYKNISVTIVDSEGNELYVYRLYTKVAQGDYITVTGVMTTYSGKRQIAQGGTAEIGSAHGNNHVYSFDCDSTCDICGATRTAADHTYDNACDADCNVCAETRTAEEHVYENDCATKCSVCEAGEREAVAPHQYANDCATKCTVCGAGEREPAGDHIYDNDCDVDCNVCAEERESTGHVYDDDCDSACNSCNAERTDAPHKYTSDCDEKCDLCGAARTTTAQHTYTNDCDADCDVCGAARAAECVDADNDGNCDSCGEVFNQATINKNHIAYEKDKISFAEVKKAGSVDLVVVGTLYTDVTVTWTSNNAAAVIADGKVTFTIGDTEQMVTLTATFTCGEETETATYFVKIGSHHYDNACDATCNDEGCGHTRTVADHAYTDNCDASCNTCGAERTAPHNYAGACDTVCDNAACGATRTVEADHTWKGTCPEGFECEVCKATRDAGTCADANEDGKCDECGADVVVDTFPAIDKPYKLSYVRGDKTYYFNGEMSTYYFATVEDIALAVNIYFEKATEGYYMYLMKDGVKTYINITTSENDKGEHINLVMEATASTVFTYDETFGFVANVVLPTSGPKVAYIGAKGTYTTIGSYATDAYDETSFYISAFVEAIDPSTCAHSYSVSCDTKCDLCGAERTDITHTDANNDNACDVCSTVIDPNAPLTVGAALLLPDNTSVKVTGTVANIGTPYDASYGNISLTIIDNNGDALYCYRLTGDWKEGDILVINGTITTYNGARQIAQGATAEKIGTHTEHVFQDATCTAPKTCVICGVTEGAAAGHTAPNASGKCDRCGFDVSIATAEESFDIAASTGALADKTITWNATNFTMVGNQAGSTTAIRTSDTDHFRIYKDSTFKISCTKGMMQITITAMSESYATAMVNSLTTTGVTASQDGAVVVFTVTDAAINELAFTASAQFRVSNITVMYVAG